MKKRVKSGGMYGREGSASEEAHESAAKERKEKRAKKKGGKLKLGGY